MKKGENDMIEKINIQGNKMYTISDNSKIHSMLLTENNIHYIKSKNKAEFYEKSIQKENKLQELYQNQLKIESKKRWIGILIALIPTLAIVSAELITLSQGIAWTPLVTQLSLVGWITSFGLGATISHKATKKKTNYEDSIEIIDDVKLELQKRIQREKHSMKLYSFDVINKEKTFENEKDKKVFENSVNLQLQEQPRKLREELLEICQSKEEEYHQEQAKTYTR